MKRTFTALICLILAAVFLAGLFAAGSVQPVETPAEILGRYPFTEVSCHAGLITSGFVYNDGFFFLDNGALWPDLAKMSAVLSSAAYNWKDLSDALSKMPGYEFSEYTEEAEAVKGNWQKEHTLEDNDFVRYTVAVKRDVEYNGENYVIYCVPIQGTSGSYDWNSDFRIGGGDDHAGFYLAHEEVMRDLYVRMSADGYDAAHRIIWTMGHSRGAAVSNIVAGELTGGVSRTLGLDFSGLVSPSHVFSYNIACPSVSKNEAVTESNYGNIFNFNSVDDLIPIVPTEDWGYGRYGETLAFSEEDRANLRQQFQRKVKKSYSGTPDMPVHMEAIINELIPNSAEANSVSAQAFFSGVAFFLNNKETKNLKNFFKAAGFFLTEHAWKIISSCFPDPGAYYDFLVAATVKLPRYLDETDGMTAEEFSQWRSANRKALEEIESAMKLNIRTREDLVSAEALAAADMLAYAADVDIDPVAIKKLLSVLKELYDYVMGGNGLTGMLSAIEHGHMSESYVLWMNSMYFGYDGWYACSGQGGKLDLALPEDVFTVGPSCFRQSTRICSLAMTENTAYLGANLCTDATGLESLELRGTWSAITAGMFRGCTGLTSVVIPDNVTAIGSSAFYGCTGLTGVILPESVTEIGKFAFANCSALPSVSIPTGVETLNVGAFIGCTSLEEIEFPAAMKMTYDGNSTYLTVFEAVTKVKLTGTGEVATDGSYKPWKRSKKAVSVEIAEGVTGIGSSAFLNAAKLARVSIPQSVTAIGSSAFYGCTGLKSLELPDHLESVGSSTFYGSGLTTVEGILEKLTVIPESAFRECVGLTAVVIPDNVTAIGERAFQGCTGLTGVTISESVTEIGKFAFAGCSALPSVSIPTGVETLNVGAFIGCTSLVEIEFPAAMKMVYPDNATYLTVFTAVTDVRLTGTGEVATDYSLKPWKMSNKAVSVEIAEGVTGIGSNAFRNAAKLARVSIPQSVTAIGSSAFYGCTGLKSLELPDHLESVGSSTFYGSGLTTAEGILEKLTAIPESAFRECVGLTAVVIPDNVTAIGERAFQGCTGLTGVTISESVTEIGKFAFAGCSALPSVSIPTGVETLNVGAFSSCTSLVEIEFPAAMKMTYDDNATYLTVFTAVTKVKLTGTGEVATDYSLKPWKRSNKAVSVEIAEGVTGIGSSAFRNAAKLAKVSIPQSVTAIGSYAFYGCTGLTDIYYGGSPEEWSRVTVGGGNTPLSSATIHYTVPVTGVTLSPSALELKVGETGTLSASVLPEDATDKSLAWSSEDPSVAAVEDGTVVALQPGSTRITVTAEDGGWTASCTVTVYAAAPELTAQPEDVTVRVGETAVFTVSAEGEDLTYRWYYLKPGSESWTAVKTGGTSAVYRLAVKERHNGYQYYCAVSNGDAAAESDVVTLTVLAYVPPVIETQPEDVTVCLGETAVFTVSAAGEDLAYRWYYLKPGSESWTAVKTGGASAVYRLAVKERHNGYQYYCSVSDGTTTVESAVVTLTVSALAPPAIETQPEDVTVCLGETAVFTVSAAGEDLSYQWYVQKIPGGEWTAVKTGGASAEYRLATKARHNGYRYCCEVSNGAGTVTSTEVTLTLKDR